MLRSPKIIKQCANDVLLKFPNEQIWKKANDLF